MLFLPKFTFCWILFCAISIHFLPGESECVNQNILEPIQSLNSSQIIANPTCIFKYLQSYFANQRFSRKSIHLLRNNNGKDNVRSMEQKIVMQLHQMESHWLSIQLDDLDDFIGQFERSQPSERQDFIWFLDDIDADRVWVIDQLFISAQSDSTHLHIIFVKRLPLERISDVFKLLSSGSVGKNVNFLMTNDVGNKWTWYSRSTASEHCGRVVLIVKAEFRWKCDRCARVNVDRFIDPSVGLHKRCQLRVGSIRSPPYMYYDEKRGFYKGIEYYMIEAIAKELNHDVVYQFINASEYFIVSDTFANLSNG